MDLNISLTLSLFFAVLSNLCRIKLPFFHSSWLMFVRSAHVNMPSFPPGCTDKLYINDATALRLLC